eukprot:10946520-Heterocapsa_arctica.AAC.1
MLGPLPVAVQARGPRTRQLGGDPACNASGGLARRRLRAGLFRRGLVDGVQHLDHGLLPLRLRDEDILRPAILTPQ